MGVLQKTTKIGRDALSNTFAVGEATEGTPGQYDVGPWHATRAIVRASDGALIDPAADETVAAITTSLGTGGSGAPALPGGSTGAIGWLRYIASLLTTVTIGTLPSIPAGSNNIGSVNVAGMPSIPGGSANIGSVNVAALPATPAGSNAIGSVTVTSIPSIPAGGNAIGSVIVTALPSLPAGSHNIGYVDVNGLGYVASGITPIASTFTGTGQSASFTPLTGRAFNISIWGTFGATVQLERSFDAGSNWLPLTAAGLQMCIWTAPASEMWEEDQVGTLYRLNCTAFTSGTVSYRISQ